MKRMCLVALLGAACTGPGSADSTGDAFAPNRIVEPVGLGQRLSLVEELRIGSVMGGNEAELLYLLKDIEIGPGGDVYALNGDEVRVFSPAGRFLRSWGREGEGPGEFQGPHEAGGRARHRRGRRWRSRALLRSRRALPQLRVAGTGKSGRYSVATMSTPDTGWVVEVQELVSRPGDPMQPEEVRQLDPASGSMGEPIVTYLRSPDMVLLSPGRP